MTAWHDLKKEIVWERRANGHRGEVCWQLWTINDGEFYALAVGVSEVADSIVTVMNADEAKELGELMCIGDRPDEGKHNWITIKPGTGALDQRKQENEHRTNSNTQEPHSQLPRIPGADRRGRGGRSR